MTLWLDLRLKGLDPAALDPTQKSLAIGHAARDRDLRYTETMLIVRSIMSAASLIVAGKGDAKLMDAVRDYTDLIYPDKEGEVVDKAKSVEEILKREYSKGPMRAEAQNYERRRRRKPK